MVLWKFPMLHSGYPSPNAKIKLNKNRLPKYINKGIIKNFQDVYNYLRNVGRRLNILIKVKY